MGDHEAVGSNGLEERGEPQVGAHADEPDRQDPPLLLGLECHRSDEEEEERNETEAVE